MSLENRPESEAYKSIVDAYNASGGKEGDLGIFKGFQVWNVVGDGSCAFNALADQYEQHVGKKIDPRKIRDAIVAFVRGKNSIQDYVATQVSGRDVDRWLTEIARPSTWGDDVAISVYAKLMKIRIILHGEYYEKNPEYEGVRDYDEREDKTDKTDEWNILYLPNHFASLRKIESTASKSTKRRLVTDDKNQVVIEKNETENQDEIQEKTRKNMNAVRAFNAATETPPVADAATKPPPAAEVSTATPTVVESEESEANTDEDNFQDAQNTVEDAEILAKPDITREWNRKGKKPKYNTSLYREESDCLVFSRPYPELQKYLVESYGKSLSFVAIDENSRIYIGNAIPNASKLELVNVVTQTSKGPVLRRVLHEIGQVVLQHTGGFEEADISSKYLRFWFGEMAEKSIPLFYDIPSRAPATFKASALTSQGKNVLLYIVNPLMIQERALTITRYRNITLDAPYVGKIGNIPNNPAIFPDQHYSINTNLDVNSSDLTTTTAYLTTTRRFNKLRPSKYAIDDIEYALNNFQLHTQTSLIDHMRQSYSDALSSISMPDGVSVPDASRVDTSEGYTYKLIVARTQLTGSDEIVVFDVSNRLFVSDSSFVAYCLQRTIYLIRGGSAINSTFTVRCSNDPVSNAQIEFWIKLGFQFDTLDLNNRANLTNSTYTLFWTMRRYFETYDDVFKAAYSTDKTLYPKPDVSWRQTVEDFEKVLFYTQ